MTVSESPINNLPAPMFIARAPLRISFFGGGTDFPEYFSSEDGAVLAMAIEKYSTVTMAMARNPLLTRPEEFKPTLGSVYFDDLKSNKIVKACFALFGQDLPHELSSSSDLPTLAGLGSSSSFTVALLAALHRHLKKPYTPLELAHEAIHVERVILRDKVGMQDQTVAAFGGLNQIGFKGRDTITVSPLSLREGRIEELESHLLLVYSNQTRRATEIEAKKLSNYEASRSTLRAMRKMVDVGRNLLDSTHSLILFGQLLNVAWDAKRTLDPAVSNPEIDYIYNTGLESGAWGGKLLGAGGGGYILFCLPPERRKHLIASFPRHICLGIKMSRCGVNVAAY